MINNEMLQRNLYLLAVVLLSFYPGQCKLHSLPEDQDVTVGETVRFTCVTDLRDPGGSVEWHFTPKDGSDYEIVYMRLNIRNDFNGRLRIESNPNTGRFDLVLSNVALDDAGKYTCMDVGNSQHQHSAELTVYDKYPSNEFCSIVSPSDVYLGKNACRLEPDVVEVSCDLRYRGNHDRHLEWSVGDLSVQSNTTTHNGTMTSTLSVKASDLLQSSNLTCKVKPSTGGVARSLSWSTLLKVNAFVDADAATHLDCNSCQTSVNCSLDNSFDCTYAWLNEINQTISSKAFIDFDGRQNGNYSCRATCRIRSETCEFLAKRVTYTFKKCSDSNQQSDTGAHKDEATPSSQTQTIVVTALITATICTAIFSVIGYICLKRKRETLTKSCDETETRLYLADESTKNEISVKDEV